MEELGELMILGLHTHLCILVMEMLFHQQTQSIYSMGLFIITCCTFGDFEFQSKVSLKGFWKRSIAFNWIFSKIPTNLSIKSDTSFPEILYYDDLYIIKHKIKHETKIYF